MLGVGLATHTDATGELGPHGTKVVQPPPAPADIASHFPQLEILECLGRGGMGVVYKARQPKLNRLVALKILAPEKGDDPKFAERFQREAQALARLNHPNIVTVHDFGEADGLYYLLMEYVDGVTLRQLLQTRKIAPEEALSIVPKICEALQFAHELGVVHRDIKPENVLLDKQGRVKIADFGIAKLVGADGPRPSLTEEQSVIGTPHYMAPEQVEKPQLVDHRADIYSLGVVFYEMLTGELPLGKFQPPSKKVQVDVRLDEVVLHALEKEPELRYQTAAQFKTGVETISSSSSPGRGTAASPARPARARGRLRAALIVGVLVWLFVAGTVTLITWIRAESWKVVAVISCPRKSEPGRPITDLYFKHAATMIELIQSDVILGRVIDRLELDERSGKLDERWGKRNLGLKLTKAQAMVMLRRRLDVRSSEGGTLIQVGVYGKRPEKPEEAMDIANTIAEETRAFRIEQHDPPADMLEMTLRATPPDILLGLAAGFVLGLLAGGLVLLFAFLRRGSQASEIQTALETIAAGPGGAPAAAGKALLPVRIMRWRDFWPWDFPYISSWMIVVTAGTSILVLALVPRLGLKALLWLWPIALGLAFATMYGVLGMRIRRSKSALPRATGEATREVADCLMFRRPFGSPGIAVLHEDRLELIPVAGSPIIVILAEIVAVKEVKWFNGTRLWLKKGFVMELANGQRVGVAVAEVFARRWRSRLSRGSLPEIGPAS